MYGIDYLAGATYKDLVVKSHPKGWGAGFFLNTFGNAWPVVKALAETGNCPVIRVHAIWDDLHQYRVGHLDLIKKELKKCCNIAKKFPSIKFEFSPFCENNFTSLQSDEVFSTCKKIIKKQEVKIKLVNCIWQGKFILNDPDIINEVHGTHIKPKKGAYNYSFDGLDAYNADTQTIKNNYTDANIFFFWTISLNLKKKANEKISVADRIKRNYRPKTVHIEALEALAKDKGSDNVPKNWIVKPMSEDCEDMKSNKLLLLIPKKSSNVKLIRNNSKNAEIETLKRFDPPVDDKYRYYAQKAGYEYVKKNACKVSIDGKIQTSNGIEIVFNPAFRGGSYK